MPEVSPQPNLESQPKQPQVQPEQVKKVYTKKIIIIVVAIVVVSAILGGLIWVFTLNKSDTADSAKVSTPSAKEVTLSSKEATPFSEGKTEKGVTSGWKIFTSESMDYLLKVPQSWETKEGADDSLCGAGIDFLAPTKDLLGKCATEFGGLVVVQQINELFTTYTNNIDMSSLKDSRKESTTVGGTEAVKVTGTYNLTEDVYSLNGSDVIDYYINQDGKVLMIEYLQKPSWPDELDTFELIISTFKFLD